MLIQHTSCFIINKATFCYGKKLHLFLKKVAFMHKHVKAQHLQNNCFEIVDLQKMFSFREILKKKVFVW